MIFINATQNNPILAIQHDDDDYNFIEGELESDKSNIEVITQQFLNTILEAKSYMDNNNTNNIHNSKNIFISILKFYDDNILNPAATNNKSQEMIDKLQDSINQYINTLPPDTIPFASFVKCSIPDLSSITPEITQASIIKKKKQFVTFVNMCYRLTSKYHQKRQLLPDQQNILDEIITKIHNSINNSSNVEHLEKCLHAILIYINEYDSKGLISEIANINNFTLEIELLNKIINKLTCDTEVIITNDKVILNILFITQVLNQLDYIQYDIVNKILIRIKNLSKNTTKCTMSQCITSSYDFYNNMSSICKSKDNPDITYQSILFHLSDIHLYCYKSLYTYNRESFSNMVNDVSLYTQEIASLYADNILQTILPENKNNTEDNPYISMMAYNIIRINNLFDVWRDILTNNNNSKKYNSLIQYLSMMQSIFNMQKTSIRYNTINTNSSNTTIDTIITPALDKIKSVWNDIPELKTTTEHIFFIINIQKTGVLDKNTSMLAILKNLQIIRSDDTVKAANALLKPIDLSLDIKHNIKLLKQNIRQKFGTAININIDNIIPKKQDDNTATTNQKNTISSYSLTSKLLFIYSITSAFILTISRALFISNNDDDNSNDDDNDYKKDIK